MIGVERLICLTSNTSKEKCLVVIWSEFNEVVMYWQKLKVPWGWKSHWAFQYHAHLSGTNSRSWDQNAAECFRCPPCRSYPGTFATFSPAHSGGNGASWPGLRALLSTLWKSSRNSRQKHIWTHNADIHLSSVTSGSDQISLAGITATDAEATTDENKWHTILITLKRIQVSTITVLFKIIAVCSKKIILNSFQFICWEHWTFSK